MTRRFLAVILVALFVAAACGQKPGVHVESGARQTQGAGFETDFAEGEGEFAEDGELEFFDDDGTGEGGGPAAGGPGGAPGGGAAPGQPGQPAEPGAGGRAQVRGSNRTGAAADVITLAVHAPATGAAPLPVASFERARDLYWRYATQVKGEKILGRSRVEVLFRDDRYQPSTAVQVCREMASRAFMVVGGGGTDQIQACGRFAESSRVPYMSGGVTESGLRGLNWYFAVSMSYKQQGVLLAQYVKRAFAGKKAAAVITDTPNFDDARDGWEQGRQQAGLTYYRTLRHPRGDTSWYNTYANELRNNNVEVVYMNTAPVDYIRFAEQAAQQGFRPQYVGVGITMGLNTVLASGCPDVANGIFLSPFPGLDHAQANLREFIAAGQRFGVETDDLALALWGIAATQHELFKRYEATYGNDLTREDFRDLVERQTNVRTGVFPQLDYSPNDHFGASQVHVLRADCQAGQHRTVATFASGF